jgi:uncharacterized protein YbcI
MIEARLSVAQKVARAAAAFHCERTGHEPKVAIAALSDDTIVITLHDALTPAMEALARSPAGVPRVQAYYRQLFVDSADSLRQEIKRITGVVVREAVAEVDATTGVMVHAFTSGNMVEVFLLTGGLSEEAWQGRCAVSDTEPREWLEPVHRAEKARRRKVREDLEARLAVDLRS